MANSIAIGVAYQDQDIINANNSLVNAVTGQFGYNTGSSTAVPTAVTQATSKSTGVTVNAPCGTITMNNAALTAGSEVAFIVTNSMVSAYDVSVVAVKSGGATAGTYLLSIATVAAGSFTIAVANASAGSLSEAIVISFALVHVAQQ